MGTLGAIEENGQWAPHVHLQLIVDLLDMGDRFPRRRHVGPAGCLAARLSPGSQRLSAGLTALARTTRKKRRHSRSAARADRRQPRASRLRRPAQDRTRLDSLAICTDDDAAANTSTPTTTSRTWATRTHAS